MNKNFYITTTKSISLCEWTEILYVYTYYIFLFEYKLSPSDVKVYLSPLSEERYAIKAVIEMHSNKKNFVLKDGELEELINHNTPYDYIIVEEIHDWKQISI